MAVFLIQFAGNLAHPTPQLAVHGLPRCATDSGWSRAWSKRRRPAVTCLGKSSNIIFRTSITISLGRAPILFHGIVEEALQGTPPHSFPSLYSAVGTLGLAGWVYARLQVGFTQPVAPASINRNQLPLDCAHRGPYVVLSSSTLLCQPLPSTSTAHRRGQTPPPPHQPSLCRH